MGPRPCQYPAMVTIPLLEVHRQQQPFIEDEYQRTQFRGDDRLESVLFPELSLTAAAILTAGASYPTEEDKDIGEHP